MAEVKPTTASKPELSKGNGQKAEIERHTSGASQHPFEFMRRIAEEMDRTFDNFGLHMPRIANRGRELFRREAGLIPAEWSPRIDIQERDGKRLVNADLPGLTKDDVKVEVGDDRLTIHGERKQESKQDCEGYSYSECSYGSFYRTIPMPKGVDSSKVHAEFQNGVLKIEIPMPSKQEAASRRIEVK